MPVTGKISGQYDPRRVEEWVKRFWVENRVYERIKKENAKCSREFNFIDGPPYPTGEVPHIGTAWNKTLKDVVLRYRRMRGYRVYDTPGYDCHGLPTEVKVEQKLGIRVKREIEERVGVDKFIEECKNLVYNNIQGMTRWFEELGVFMDWSNPYLTLNDNYIEAAWWLIKRVHENGLLDREYRVVYWCPRCSTTLAEYEVEYKDLEDPSIYVKFPVKGRDKWFLVIWTTTPWTLPANTFIMVHPDENYVAVKVCGEVYIVAEARLDHFLREAGISDYEVVARYKGIELSSLKYGHPLDDIVPLQKKLNKYHRVVVSREYVTMYEGTGLVHGAPGHGFEDFIVARENGIDLIASPLDDEGRFTEETGKYAGIYVREANKLIIEDLERKGALLALDRVIHKYPVCWRCKTPVVMRATPQWIIRVTKLKKKLLEEAGKVNWIPGWGYDRIRHIIENLQDWVLSRQRYWGTPLPIWVCPKGHRVVVGSKQELVEYGGQVPKELHRPWIDEVVIKCPFCGLDMKRVPDVTDVWFDSAVCFYAAKGHPEKLGLDEIILDFIVEGQDQFRGWFFSLLRAGVLGFGKVPYRSVLVHGMMLDEKGREMHKSLGNYVGLDEAINRVGRDPLRLWVSQSTPWEDLRFSWKVLEEVKRDLGIAWNTFVFASTYMNLDGFDPRKHRVEDYYDDLRVEDRWILSRINTLIDEVTQALNTYRVHEAARKLMEFIVEDVSHWYIRIIRPRVWVEENTRDKLAAYSVLYYVLYRWLVMISPFTPFFAEKVYQEIFRKAEPELPLSVHMLSWVEVDEKYVNREVEKDMEFVKKVYEAAAAARMKAGIKLRQPVKSLVVYSNRDELIKIAVKYSDLIARVVNAKSVEVKPVEELSEIVKYRVAPEYRVIGPKYKDIAKKLFKYIEENQDKVARDILSARSHKALIDGIEVVLTERDVRITPTYLEGYSVEDREWGSVAIDTRLTVEEVSEGLARDLVRRIQVMRKEMNLELDDRIETYVYAPKHHVELLERYKDYIMGETRSTRLVITSEEEAVASAKGYRREWEIQGEKYVIVVLRHE
ncbi:MAG: isoleucine--tRNA ligase [Thermoprotei archaeon]|nr:MAG: isoleucine--tRNA ligase [Thermoprotei archaeon]